MVILIINHQFHGLLISTCQDFFGYIELVKVVEIIVKTNMDISYRRFIVLLS
jgi:hypothetical protein